jgi:surface protein
MDQGVYDFIVDWGDGKSDVIKSWNDPAKVHQYASHGSYKVVVKGKFFGFEMFGSPTAEKLVEIMQFGRLRLENGNFAGAKNLKISASDPLDLTGATTMSRTFSDCSSLTTAPSLAKWDTSKVTTMAAMFQGATKFNENISAWDVRNVTNMDYMFQDAKAFNQPIGSWDVSKVTTMRSMFQRAARFTNDLSSWNVGSLVDMDLMFDNSGLSASLPSWYRPNNH